MRHYHDSRSQIATRLHSNEVKPNVISISLILRARRQRDRFATYVCSAVLLTAILAFGAVLAQASEPEAAQANVQTASFSTSLPHAESNKLELKLKTNIAVAANLVKLSDLVDTDLVANNFQPVVETVLAPSPIEGVKQVWAPSDIESLLRLRGVDIGLIKWSGADNCVVTRSTIVASDQAMLQNVQPAAVDENFIPTAVVRKSSSIAERNAADAIVEYLRIATSSEVDYELEVDIPAEGAKFLSNRRAIIGVAGGEAPWVGPQKFQIKTKQRDGEVIIEARAQVELPAMVYATNRSLGRDHIITEADLKLVSLGKISRVREEDCFSDLKSLVGKQLNRTIATGQPIERSQVGNPRLISVNDPVEIQVMSAAMKVTSTGRALQGGGLDDVIMVEVMPHRSKVAARVVQPGVVTVVTVGGR